MPNDNSKREEVDEYGNVKIVAKRKSKGGRKSMKSNKSNQSSGFKSIGQGMLDEIGKKVKDDVTKQKELQKSVLDDAFWWISRVCYLILNKE